MSPKMSAPVDFRSMARRWRSGSKARALKLGRMIDLPSIDEVFDHLCSLPVPLRCSYCDVRIYRPQMDHRISLSRGGSAETSNLALTCKPCNLAKGPLNEVEWRSLLSFLDTWEDAGAAKSLLSRLRGAFWCYKPAVRARKNVSVNLKTRLEGPAHPVSCAAQLDSPKEGIYPPICHQHRVRGCDWCAATGGDGYID
jgi:5-methylcytosine-specific restriction endonuclease McrA